MFYQISPPRTLLTVCHFFKKYLDIHIGRQAPSSQLPEVVEPPPDEDDAELNELREEVGNGDVSEDESTAGQEAENEYEESESEQEEED